VYTLFFIEPESVVVVHAEVPSKRHKTVSNIEIFFIFSPTTNVSAHPPKAPQGPKVVVPRLVGSSCFFS
jgi:hypothetical protein